MHHIGRVEGRKCLTRQLHAQAYPREQSHHDEHQARQRRSSGADEYVKVLPGGKRRELCLLHDGSSFKGSMQTIGGLSSKAREADEERLGDVYHRATPGVRTAHPCF